MARALNRARVRHTRLLVLICLGMAAALPPSVSSSAPLHDLLDMVGELLIAVCVVGRLYCTVHLGGHKNEHLVTTGPFAWCRNPLYAFSFIGFCGVGVISDRLLIASLLPILYIAIYRPLISREEMLLKQTFGASYVAYCASVPRWWPRRPPIPTKTPIAVHPEFLAMAAIDGLSWFFVLPLFELLEHVQRTLFGW